MFLVKIYKYSMLYLVSNAWFFAYRFANIIKLLIINVFKNLELKIVILNYFLKKGQSFYLILILKNINTVICIRKTNYNFNLMN